MTSGGPFWNKSGDYRDTNWYRCRIRNHEWLEKQPVSLLDIKGLRPENIGALWKAEIRTVTELIEADTEDILLKLQPYRTRGLSGANAIERIKGWQEEAESMLEEFKFKQKPNDGI